MKYRTLTQYRTWAEWIAQTSTPSPTGWRWVWEPQFMLLSYTADRGALWSAPPVKLDMTHTQDQPNAYGVTFLRTRVVPPASIGLPDDPLPALLLLEQVRDALLIVSHVAQAVSDWRIGMVGECPNCTDGRIGHTEYVPGKGLPRAGKTTYTACETCHGTGKIRDDGKPYTESTP